MNTIYSKLSGFRLLADKYALKFLFIAFLGIHVPLIGLIVFIVFFSSAISTANILILTLLLTLVATGVTLYVLNNLLEPLKLSKKALADYLNERKLPNLPTNFTDEAGILMHKVQETIVKLDSILDQKKDLIGLLSHDLRAPMVNIKMLADYMGNDYVQAAEMKEMSGMISQTVDRQIALFQEILDILKQEDLSWVKLKLQQLSSTDLLAQVQLDIAPMAAKKNITVVYEDLVKDSLTIETNLFPQVLKNLLNNAIKFSFEQSTVHVKIDKQAEKVRIAVMDKGLGFHPEDAQDLFTKFTHKRKKGTHDEPTTGMGLYLSKKIIEAHNGIIAAKSEGPNKGACFEILL